MTFVVKNFFENFLHNICKQYGLKISFLFLTIVHTLQRVSKQENWPLTKQAMTYCYKPRNFTFKNQAEW